MVRTDTMHVIHARAQQGSTCTRCRSRPRCAWPTPGTEAEVLTRQFSALPSGLAALVDWLRAHAVSAAVMEGTGIYWEAPWQALEHAGIEALLVHAQHVKQLRGRKTDIADSVWLARICQFGLCAPSLVPSGAVSHPAQSLSHAPSGGARACAHAQPHPPSPRRRRDPRRGYPLGPVRAPNGARILEGLVAGEPRDAILASLSHHVRSRTEELCDALSAQLDEPSRFVLHDLLHAFHHATERLADYDAVLGEGLSECDDQLALLMTIPGIDRASARAILIELGPDIGVFASRRHCAAWAGAVSRQQRKCRQTPLGQNPTGQYHLARSPHRVCSRRRAHPPLPVPRLSQGAHRAPRLQARHRRHRPQDAARHLPRPDHPHALPRPRKPTTKR